MCRYQAILLPVEATNLTSAQPDAVRNGAMPIVTAEPVPRRPFFHSENAPSFLEDLDNHRLVFTIVT